MSFKYYNQNPNGYHIPDCVIRAISTALDIDYYDVVKMLKSNSEIYNCDTLCVCCYEKLLDLDFRLPHYYGDGRTANEIAEDYPRSILLLRMDGHLSTSVDGQILDIWDCGNEIITDYWVVD